MQGKNRDAGGMDNIFGGNSLIEAFASKDKKGIYPKCLQLISEIIKTEGYDRNTSFSSEKALNLDKVERLRGNVENDNTVDFVVALLPCELLLVEAKYRISNARNLLPKLADKISHSEALLHSCDNAARISGRVVLLFPNKNFEVNIRELRRRINEEKSGVIKSHEIRALRTEDFYSKYFAAYRA